MPDRSSAKHFLAFSQECGALRRIVLGTAQGADDLWPAELRSCFSADRQRLSQHFGSFRASPGVKQNPSLHFETCRLESPCAKLSDKPHHSAQVALHQIEVAVLIASEHAQGFAYQFGAGLSYKCGGASSSVAFLFCLQHLIEIDAADPNHRAVGHFDATESVLLAQRNAATEVIKRAAHLALSIRRVSKPTESARLCFRRARALRKAEASLVLLAATVDVPKWKEDITPQVMDAREFRHHIVALGCALRVRKEIKCFFKAVAHPKTLRQSQLRSTHSDFIWRCGYRQPIGCYGRSDISEIALQFTLEADKGVTVGIGLRDLQAAISQPECAIDMKGRAQSASRSKVCLGSPGVLGTVEVLCVQRKVLVREPFRSQKVQFAATGSKQGGVRSLLDKRMSEQEIITLR